MNLADEQWEVLEPLIPELSRRGRSGQALARFKRGAKRYPVGLTHRRSLA
jgi:hypothetical protein